MIETKAETMPTLTVLYGAKDVSLYIVPPGAKKTSSKHCAITLPRDPKLKAADPNVVFLVTVSKAREAIEHLKYAIKCIDWCRKHHPDPQKGDGIPSELIFQDFIDTIEGKV